MVFVSYSFTHWNHFFSIHFKFLLQNLLSSGPHIMSLLLLSNNHRKTLKPIYFQSSQKRHSNSAPIQWPLRYEHWIQRKTINYFKTKCIRSAAGGGETECTMTYTCWPKSKWRREMKKYTHCGIIGTMSFAGFSLSSTDRDCKALSCWRRSISQWVLTSYHIATIHIKI